MSDAVEDIERELATPFWRLSLQTSTAARLGATAVRSVLSVLDEWPVGSLAEERLVEEVRVALRDALVRPKS